MIFNRTEMIFGKEAVARFKQVKVAVFGLGGVGSYACESLARSGFSRFVLVDFDTVDRTNINRQNIALHSTIGKAKTDVMMERLLDINPDCEIEFYNEFADINTRNKMLSNGVDFVVDAIDSLNPKVGLLEDVYNLGIPIISSMGAGNRIDPSQVRLSDLFESQGCPLASRVRKYLRRRGISSGIPCVYSSEKPVELNLECNAKSEVSRGRARVPVGSVSYMTAIMGLWVSSYVIRTIANR